MNLSRITTPIKSLLLTLSASTTVFDSESDNAETPTTISIEENKNSQKVLATFHPDAFFAKAIQLLDEPPLLAEDAKLNELNESKSTDEEDKNNETEIIELKLNKFCSTIQFQVTISQKLCDWGYVRVVAERFFDEIREYYPMNVSLPCTFKKHHLYIPMTVELPVINQRSGIFDDTRCPTLIALNDPNPKLYRYKLTEAFKWRYQYVRIRKIPSLKMDKIGEIPCDLSMDIIGYPVRAILPNFIKEPSANIVEKEMNERKEAFGVKEWTLFENSYWVKIQPKMLGKLPLMKGCVEALNKFEQNNEESNDYFGDKGYVIQQYLGHSVLECLGPLVAPKQNAFSGIPISFDDDNNLFVEKNDEQKLFYTFPLELISHILSFCSFEFVRSVTCCISKQFYEASMLPLCYHNAVIPSILLDRMLKKGTLSKMLHSLKKCRRIDMYSLICEEETHSSLETLTLGPTEIKKQSSKIVMNTECNVEQFHLEFVSDLTLHIAIFSVFDFSNSLKILKLTQCDNINEFALKALPCNIEELYLMNTVINIESWANLKSLKSLIITTNTTSSHLHQESGKFYELIVETLPKQILELICIWDGQESNNLIIKQLVENHNETLDTFGIGGRICLYHPFSIIFCANSSKAYSNLEIMTISLLTQNEIKDLVQAYGPQLRVLELYCPFVVDEELDIYQWMLAEENVDMFCSALVKLEVLMVQAFAHHMKRYMNVSNGNGWKELKMKFQQKFRQHRNQNGIKEIPLVLFDFNMDLSTIRRWRDEGMKEYLIKNEKKLELNYGQGG